MGINFGNYQSNNFIVNHGDGYEEYRGLGGNDIYNVNKLLTENVMISDSQGSNKVVLGNAEITSTDFVSAGVIFHYAEGGSLTVLGDVSNYNFIFGGGTDPFNPTSGGTSLSFNETAQAFGINPDSLSMSVVQHGNISGTIQSDGSIDQTNNSETMTLDGMGTLQVPAILDASQKDYLFLDNSTAAENVVVQNFEEGDHLQINIASEVDYVMTHDGADIVITSNLMTGNIIKIILENIVSPDELIYDDPQGLSFEEMFEQSIGFDAISFTGENHQTDCDVALQGVLLSSENEADLNIV